MLVIDVSEIELRSKVFFAISNDSQGYTPPPFVNTPAHPTKPNVNSEHHSNKCSPPSVPTAISAASIYPTSTDAGLLRPSNAWMAEKRSEPELFRLKQTLAGSTRAYVLMLPLHLFVCQFREPSPIVSSQLPTSLTSAPFVPPTPPNRLRYFPSPCPCQL